MDFFQGNTARKFFQNGAEVAALLNLPEFLVTDLGVIWQVLVSGHSIKSDEFQAFCDNFVEKFNADPNINWYEFSPTLHKGLNHLLL